MGSPTSRTFMLNGVITIGQHNLGEHAVAQLANTSGARTKNVRAAQEPIRLRLSDQIWCPAPNQ